MRAGSGQENPGYVIFKQICAVRKVSAQAAVEFVKCELVPVEWINLAALLRVVEPVRRGDNQYASGAEHAVHFFQKNLRIFQMFDDFKRHYQIETRGREGKREAIGFAVLDAQRATF